MSEPILIGKSSQPVYLLPALANRHGLIAGATGTGKTVSLQVLAENLSNIGVPVFMADVKGDLAGLSQAAGPNPKVEARIKKLKLEDYAAKAAPVVFWDVFGELGHPARATISEMGPLLLGRMLNLNDVQQGVLTMAFEVADDQGWLLLDLKDLRAMLQHVGDNASTLKTQYGNVSPASIGAIQRGLLELEAEGGEMLFGEPALSIQDFLQNAPDGRGIINILAAEKLMQRPRVYAAFLLWLLSELYEALPEVGDKEKPRMVFFFDEAHLLFDNAPDALLDKIEQVVRLIRSKGIGVFFITQNPLDVPDKVLGQLGNRIQHALRAFTPRDEKAVRAAAETFRTNPKVDVAKAITELEVGEALVSVLDEKGAPTPVERTFMLPPKSRIGAIDAAERQTVVRASVIYGHYEKQVDRESAYELLKVQAEKKLADVAQTKEEAEKKESGGMFDGIFGGGSSKRQGVVEALSKSAARAIGSEIGRRVIRGVLGSVLRGKR